MSIWYNKQLLLYPIKKMAKTGMAGGREFEFGSRCKLVSQNCLVLLLDTDC